MFPSYAKVGLGVATGGGVRSCQPGRRPSQPRTGWTAPTVIYDKMRQIQTNAASLDSDVKRNVSREAFRQAWATWFARWTAFFQKYQTEAAKLGAVTYTDELNAQTETFRTELVGWYDNYARERDATGQPVPPATTTGPALPPPPPPGDKPSEGISIWWLVGGAVVLGLGYVAYKNLKAANETVRSIAPALVGGMVNPAGTAMVAASNLATAHDPGFARPVLAPGAPLGYLPPHYRVMAVPYGQ